MIQVVHENRGTPVIKKLEIVSISLAILLGSGWSLAETPQATLNISGAVTVNGKPAPQPSTVFSGDKIQTGPDSTASLAGEGVEVTLPENSELTYSPDSLTLGCGSSSVFTKAGKSILRTADGTVITPSAADGFNKIEVTQGAGTTLIRVVLGSASVMRGQNNSVVKAGYQLEIPGSSCTAAATHLNSGTPAASPAAAAKAGGSAAKIWIPVLIGGGGGAAAAAVLLSNGNDTPVSPSAP
jgi:hypothetical protein